MRPYRRKLGQRFTSLTGIGRGLAGDGSPERFGDIYYGILLTSIVIASFIILLVASPVTAQIVLAVLWGIFLGWAVLLYLPPKFIVGVFGGFVGVGATDLASLAVAVEESNKGLERIVKALTGGTVDVTVIPLAYWLFILLVALFCIPALKR